MGQLAFGVPGMSGVRSCSTSDSSVVFVGTGLAGVAGGGAGESPGPAGGRVVGLLIDGVERVTAHVSTAAVPAACAAAADAVA